MKASHFPKKTILSKNDNVVLTQEHERQRTQMPTGNRRRENWKLVNNKNRLCEERPWCILQFAVPLFVSQRSYWITSNQVENLKWAPMLCSKIPRWNQIPLNEIKEGTGKITKDQRNKDKGYWFSREPDAVISNSVWEKKAHSIPRAVSFQPVGRGSTNPWEMAPPSVYQISTPAQSLWFMMSFAFFIFFNSGR